MEAVTGMLGALTPHRRGIRVLIVVGIPSSTYKLYTGAMPHQSTTLVGVLLSLHSGARVTQCGWCTFPG